jgi:hypothetical protein
VTTNNGTTNVTVGDWSEQGVSHIEGDMLCVYYLSQNRFCAVIFRRAVSSGGRSPAGMAVSLFRSSINSAEDLTRTTEARLWGRIIAGNQRMIALFPTVKVTPLIHSCSVPLRRGRACIQTMEYLLQRVVVSNPEKENAMSVRSPIGVIFIGLCFILAGCLHSSGPPFQPYHPAWAEK